MSNPSNPHGHDSNAPRGRRFLPSNTWLKRYRWAFLAFAVVSAIFVAAFLLVDPLTRFATTQAFHVTVLRADRHHNGQIEIFLDITYEPEQLSWPLRQFAITGLIPSSTGDIGIVTANASSGTVFSLQCDGTRNWHGAVSGDVFWGHPIAVQKGERPDRWEQFVIVSSPLAIPEVKLLSQSWQLRGDFSYLTDHDLMVAFYKLNAAQDPWLLRVVKEQWYAWTCRKGISKGIRFETLPFTIEQVEDFEASKE